MTSVKRFWERLKVPKDKTCQDCRFCVDRACRRYPPSILMTQFWEDEFRWETHTETQYPDAIAPCGEFKPKRKERTAQSLPASDWMPPIGDTWNRLAADDFPRILPGPNKGLRFKQAKDRHTEKPHGPFWCQVIQRMNRSDFLRGKTEARDKPLGFDFMIRPGSAQKILEGLYDNRTPETKGRENTALPVWECTKCGLPVHGAECMQCV